MPSPPRSGTTRSGTPPRRGTSTRCGSSPCRSWDSSAGPRTWVEATPLDLPADLVVAPPRIDEDVRVTYEYPTRRARSADEVTWFLDLEGFPRDRREHSVVARGARLVASYDVEGGPGLAHARLEVELVDPGLPPARATSSTPATWSRPRTC